MSKRRTDSQEDDFFVEDFNDMDEDCATSDVEISVEEEFERKPSDEHKKKKKKKESQKVNAVKEFFSWVMTLVIAVVFALLLKNYVIINATVPTGSMENTIAVDDNLFGFRLAYLNSKPARGDIIIFKFPDDETQKYIKRVIGLPGDTVTITDGKVYINNETEPLQEDYLKEEWVKANGPYVFQVPQDSYFVMGDNRNDSCDSRYWNNTYVTSEEILGKALFIYYPFDHMRKL